MSTDITYDNMVEKLPEAIPELKERFEQEMSSLGDKDLSYVVYSFVLYRHIEELLKADQNEDQLRKVFAFLETILTHPDARVRDVADQSICENICSDEVILQRAQRYLGPAAKKSCADYMGHKSRER